MYLVGLFGQIMVFLAGAAAALDLIAISKWKDKVKGRIDTIDISLAYLKFFRPLRRIVDRMKINAATETDYATEYFTSAEFAAFVKEGRAKYFGENPGWKNGMFGPGAKFPYQPDERRIADSFETPAYEFLMNRLSRDDAETLEQIFSDFYQKANRILEIVNILFLLALPSGILLAVIYRDPRASSGWRSPSCLPGLPRSLRRSSYL